MKVLFIFLIFILTFTTLSFAFTLSSDRSHDWTGNVGVEGGIPTRTTEINCVTSYGVPVDGVTNARPTIQNCLNGIASGEVAYLPAGTYSIDGSAISVPSNKTLRGAGMLLTTIVGTVNTPQYSSTPRVGIEGSYYDCRTSEPYSTVTVTATKGSYSVTVDDASSFASGNYVYVDTLNDTDIPVNPTGVGSWGGGCPTDANHYDRVRSFFTKVQSVDGNIITFVEPIYWELKSSLSPHITKSIGTMRTGAGIESMTIKNGPEVTNNWALIRLSSVVNSWVKDVKLERCGNRCLQLSGNARRNEFREIWMYDCIDRYNSDRCYGIEFASSVSGNLVEDNIMDTIGFAFMPISSSGNVIAYNYSHNVHRTNQPETWFWGDYSTHGAHASYNLFEGNDFIGMSWDVYFGSNSHNVLFRNRVHGYDETISYTQPISSNLQQNGAIVGYPNQNYNSEIGNILGESGFTNGYETLSFTSYNSWVYRNVDSYTGLDGTKARSTRLRHRNYDYYTNGIKNCNDIGEPGCQDGDSDSNIPNSLYLVSKPTWYGNCIWPPIVASTGTYNSIPAKLRYEGSSCGESPSSTRTIMRMNGGGRKTISNYGRNILMIQ